jgi:hypothetical protein
MLKLVQLSAMWQKNHRHGIEVTLTRDFGDLDDLMATLTEDGDRIYNSAVRQSRAAELLTDVYSQLLSIGLADKSRPLPKPNLISAIGKIWLLERQGFLQPDEHNGLRLEIDD